jgi:hypothetical protein
MTIDDDDARRKECLRAEKEEIDRSGRPVMQSHQFETDLSAEQRSGTL